MKTKISILLVAFALLFSCQQDISSDKIKKGMIKMTIFYPNVEGSTFDMDYYSNKHMPMAAELMGDAMKAMSIDKGLSGASPAASLPYVAVGYFYFETMADFQNAMGPNQEQIKADVPNYTNIQPVIQLSEVVTSE